MAYKIREKTSEQGVDQGPRIAPQNLEAEICVLGGVLLNNEALIRIQDILSPEDFYRSAHGLIYAAMLELSDRSEPIDYITLVEHLGNKEKIGAVGGASFIASLADGIPAAANITYYARIVKERAILRRLIRVASDIVTSAYQGVDDVENFLEDSERSVFEVAQKKVKVPYVPLREVVKESYENIAHLYETKEFMTGIPSGFRELDQMTQGFQKGDLIVVAGRPSMGKTALCLNIARYVSLKKGLPVLIYSLEMSRHQLGFRMLCSEARVDSKKLREGYFPMSDWKYLANATGNLSEAPIYIDDSPILTMRDIRSRARRLKSETDSQMIILDYIQLVTGRREIESREQQISEVSRQLKALAKELNVPMIVLSQLNRQVEARRDKKPILADLRESGAIEQDADLILFIYRPEVYGDELPGYEQESMEGRAQILVRKNRNGPIGDIDLAFIKEYTRFEELAKEEY